jgi:putative endonuclease
MINTREKGNIGEDIACDYLKKLGFLIQDRNYLKKWGEIDIVAVKAGIIHFIEVKSVIHNGQDGGYRPEENVHDLKLRRLRRVIQTYLNDEKYGLDAEFQFHVLVVRINKSTGESNVEMIEHVIL